MRLTLGLGALLLLLSGALGAEGFRVDGNRLVDAKGRPVLLRGTELPVFRLDTVAQHSNNGDVYGAYTATSLSAIRLRFNMNAVRLPVDPAHAGDPEFFPALRKVVQAANGMELTVILSAAAPSAFWTQAAQQFRHNPNVLFAAESPAEEAIAAIREQGVKRPVIATVRAHFEGVEALADGNLVYAAPVELAKGRSAAIGKLAGRVPVMVTGWDLKVDDATACKTVSSDPSEVSAIVQANLDYYDAHGVSWTVSTFEPGKLIKDLSFHDATTLENGWTCGKPAYPYAGLGRLVQGHLRRSTERGLFVVSGSGGPEIARGAIALAYGPVMAERDAGAKGPKAASSLGRIAIEVTDSAGVTRPAGMLWASAGWGQTNFVIPEESAAGPAVMRVVRQDGSRTEANIVIADTAPGFVTGHSCRGPAIGVAFQKTVGSARREVEISRCEGIHCRSLEVPIALGTPTEVRLVASGFRHAASVEDIEVLIAGVKVPVISYGPRAGGTPGTDEIAIAIPPALAGVGETDLVARVNGRISNPVRIRLAGR